VGKLFSETILSGRVERFGSEESEASSLARNARSSLKQAWVRAPEISWAWEFKKRASDSKAEEHEAVVCVRRSDWDSVTLIEEFVGRFNFVSLFPQYLTGKLAPIPDILKT
jgi:hypothetical protein